MNEKILFIQTAFIGDAILTLPALQKLKEIFPLATIDVLCIPDSKEIFESSPVLNDVKVFDKRGLHKSLLKTFKYCKELRKEGYSRIYSSHRSFRTALIILLLEVKESFGFDNSSLMHVYKNLIPYKINKHEVQRNLDLIGFKYDDNTWKILPNISSKKHLIDKIKSFIDFNNLLDGFIAFAPGSIWNTKKYSLDYYKVLVEHFINQNNKVVLIGGKNDIDVCSSLASKFGSNVIDASGNFSVVESIELLRNAKLLISNDSAPTHMGMCADIRVLTVYCSTVPGFGFYPYNEKSSCVSFDDLECKPCGVHGYRECPIKTFDCGLKLLPEVIINEAEEMLGE
jgi:heptosyltransferase-2